MSEPTHILCHDVNYFPDDYWGSGGDVWQITVPQGTLVSNVYLDKEAIKRKNNDLFCFTVPMGTVVITEAGCNAPRKNLTLQKDTEYSTVHGCSIAVNNEANVAQVRECWRRRKEIERLENEIGDEWNKVESLALQSLRLVIIDKGGLAIHIEANTKRWAIHWADYSVDTKKRIAETPLSNIVDALEYLRGTGHFEGDSQAVASTASRSAF